jgi:hypothetical protein
MKRRVIQLVLLLRRLCIAAPLLLLASGCSTTRVISSEELPVYGTSPLMHTMYLGTDDQFHHFAIQHGKTGSQILMRRDDARISPEPFSLDSGRHAFVRSASEKEIELIVLRAD